MVKLDDLLGKVNPDPEKASDLGSVHRAKCDSEDNLGKCGSLVKALRACEALVDDARPDQEAVPRCRPRGRRAEERAGQGAHRRREVPRPGADGRLCQRAAEEARGKRPKDAADAREARRAGAREQPRRRVPTAASAARSAAGSFRRRRDRVARHRVVSTVTDYAKAFKKVKDNAKVREAIDAAIQKLVKDAKGQIEIPGVDDHRAREDECAVMAQPGHPSVGDTSVSGARAAPAAPRCSQLQAGRLAMTA
jgi:hypothetical protein